MATNHPRTIHFHPSRQHRLRSRHDLGFLRNRLRPLLHLGQDQPMVCCVALERRPRRARALVQITSGLRIPPTPLPRLLSTAISDSTSRHGSLDSQSMGQGGLAVEDCLGFRAFAGDGACDYLVLWDVANTWPGDAGLRSDDAGCAAAWFIAASAGRWL